MIRSEWFALLHSYLEHGDYGLAIRRTLDAAFDTDDKSLIREAILWGNRGHDFLHRNQTPDQHFTEKGLEILTRIESAEASPAPYLNEECVLAKAVSKRYTKGGFMLEPLDLSIRSGEIVGVVGENGNGKTTLLRILSGELKQGDGTLHYYFSENHGNSPYQIKQEVALIPQRIPRWYGTLKENLHFYASANGFYGEDNLLMTDFMLARFNLTSFANHTWNRLSSGYRTRFEIAKILLKRPRLLVLDEPLANLDINAQQTLLNDLRFMAQSAHKPLGIVLSSQQLHEVEKIADKVLFLKNGKLLHTQKQGLQTETVLEMEIKATRAELENALKEISCTIKFNGGYYVVSSSQETTAGILAVLVRQNLIPVYFRDISQSTKRFF
jgi:ABC-2 type transport system ATP-binding protein